MSTLFALPDVGEGLTEADIISWKVSAGDTVTVNQILVEIETAKSLVELPSPHQGRVESLLIDEGATVQVGTPIIAFTRPEANAEQQPDATEPESRTTESGESSGATLVGYGPAAAAGTARRRRKKDRVLDSCSVSAEGVAAGPELSADGTAVPDVRQHPEKLAALAKPPVRRLAKDWGIDINEVTGTGVNGIVTRADLVAHNSSMQVSAGTRQGPGGFAASSGAECELRIPLKGVRKATAKAMVDSAFTAPHVTEFLDIDVTRTMEFVRFVKQRDMFGPEAKVSPLAVAAKAVCWAISRTPDINSCVDGDEIVVKDYVNLGIAAATDRGLIVPNIKNAQELGVSNLAAQIRELAESARAGKSTPAAQANGTITITNVGVFGVDSGTPIINPGEGAIVALGQIRKRPWVVDDSVEAREVMTVSVSADHRIVDGAAISTFLSDIGRALEEPRVMLT